MLSLIVICAPMRHYTLFLLNHEYQHIESLPAKYRITGSKFVAWTLIIFGFVFGLESIFVAISAAVDGTLQETILGTKHIVLGPIGALFFVWGLNQFFIEGALVIDRFSVSCSYKRLFGHREWTEPLSNYRIRKRVETSKETETGSQLLYCIWLWHDRRSRRVKVYHAGSSTHWEEQADFYARLFRLRRTDHERGR